MSFHVTRSPESPPGVTLEKISWAIKNKSDYLVFLHVSPGEDVPKWGNFQDKFEKRVHVLNTMTLRIDNLTLEDSGQYWARVSFTGERETIRYFHLTVYGRWWLLPQYILTPCFCTLECPWPPLQDPFQTPDLRLWLLP